MVYSRMKNTQTDCVIEKMCCIGAIEILFSVE